jgi:hypothetical protein
MQSNSRCCESNPYSILLLELAGNTCEYPAEFPGIPKFIAKYLNIAHVVGTFEVSKRFRDTLCEALRKRGQESGVV